MELLNSWLEWCHELQAEELGTCTTCDGYGDHGFEEETGCLYTCYGCGGTGKYYPYSH